MEQVHRILAELSGESRDIALRRALEETARDHVIGLLMHEDYDRVTQWYAHDVTMVFGLDTTLDGEILKGHDEVIQHFTNLQEQTDIVVVPVLVIADRGRITAYTETYYRWLGKDDKEDGEMFVEEPVEAPFVGWPAVVFGDVLKVREVVVFDLNGEMKVKRVEWRQLGMEHLGDASLDAMALQSEKLKLHPTPKRIMSSRNQHDRFQVFADELTGDSRDRPLRYEIENKISVFFDDINEKRWTSVKSYFNDDARVIFGFRSPNQIIDKDVDLVIERIREKTDGMRRVTVPTLVLVDRGRVTCFLTNLWIDIDERDDDATLDLVEADTLFGEMHEVAIIDLDDEYKFKRVEFRTTTRQEIRQRGTVEDFEYLVRKTRRKLAGSSQDRAMRPVIEQMVRQFFRACDNEEVDPDIILNFFNDNPTVVARLDRPGNIWIGTAEVKQWIEAWDQKEERTVPQSIIVDRGRVSCHTITFVLETNDRMQFVEVHDVIIMDLDKNNRIERLEYRATTRKDTEHKGGPELLDALAEKAEKNAIDIDYLS
ncbi:hypothetical protein K4K56_006337 [Colletotrichum sp. SAR 10_98]|nr:hypothetical protein K4K56_006337 [Colletotrichum sp. SAR 10_98]